MRKMALCLAVLVVVGGAFAMAGEHEQGTMKGKTHDLTVEVVSVDMDAMTMTFKTEDGEKTAPVMKEAQGQMEGVKAGEMVTLTCMDTEGGDHEGIVKIKHAEKKG